MKIAIFCYNHSDATMPLSKYLALLEPGIEVDFFFLLSQSALDIEILSLKDKDAGIGFIAHEKLAKLIDKEVFDYFEGKVKLNIFVFNSNKLTDLKNFRQLFEFKKKITDDGYDMLHFVGGNHWVIMLSYLFRKTPHIHTLHEPYPFVEQSRYRLARHNWKIGLLIKSGVHITVPSLISYKRFREHFAIADDRLSVSPFGPFEIYKMYLKEDLKKSENILLYYGNISKYKGIEILIEAMGKMTKGDPEFKLIIAGNGPFDHDLSMLQNEVELINRYLCNEEIASYNQLATLVVCPYTSASQSGVVMTSFAFGNPVIATAVGALPEAVEDGVTGVIVPPGDPDALYHTIMDLFKNPKLIEKMRKDVFSKYSDSESSWTSLAQQTYHLYKKMQPINECV